MLSVTNKRFPNTKDSLCTFWPCYFCEILLLEKAQIIFYGSNAKQGSIRTKVRHTGDLY